MLHQALGSLAEWRSFPARLGRHTNCGVFAYSRANHGDSETLTAPPDHAYLDYEAQTVLPEILQSALIAHPILFGHSDGATIALLFASAFPERCAGLVVEAPHVFVEACTVAGVSEAREAYRSGRLRQQLAPYHANPDAAFAQWSEIWLDPAFRSWNIEASLSRISCPVMAIAGRIDAYGTAAQLDAIAARVHDCETLLFDDCGHTPHRERPYDVLAASARLVRRATGTA